MRANRSLLTRLTRKVDGGRQVGLSLQKPAFAVAEKFDFAHHMFGRAIHTRREMTQTVARRSIYLPDSIEELVHAHMREDESFSAAVARLLELGAEYDQGEFDEEEIDEQEFPLGYIGAGNSGLPDLAINAEKYLGLKPWGPGEGPADEDPA